MIFVSVQTPFCGADGGTGCLDASSPSVYGEDGIFGLPGWPWRADDTPDSHSRRQQAAALRLQVAGADVARPGQKLTR